MSKTYKELFPHTDPYDCEILKYDYDDHMYYLQQDFVRKFVNGEEQTESLIYDISNLIYIYLYSYKQNPLQYDIFEYELSHNVRYREILKRALTYQLKYAITSSGDTIHMQHGVDIQGEKVININTLRGSINIDYKSMILFLINGMLANSTEINDFDYENYRKDY